MSEITREQVEALAVNVDGDRYEVAYVEGAIEAAVTALGDTELCDRVGIAFCGGATDAVWVGTRHVEALLVALRQTRALALSLLDERDALKADAARYAYCREKGQWVRRVETVGYGDDQTERTEECTFLEVRVPNGANLSCAAMVDAAIDAAREGA